MRRSVTRQLSLVPAPFSHEHVRSSTPPARFSTLIRSSRGGCRPTYSLAASMPYAARRDERRTSPTCVGDQAGERVQLQELAFHLADSQSYRTFCLIGFVDKPPKKSTLQRNLKQVRAETLERINRALVAHAQQQEIENGRRLRSDATVVETAIHEPTDSTLLVDCSARVDETWLRETREYVALDFTNQPAPGQAPGARDPACCQN